MTTCTVDDAQVGMPQRIKRERRGVGKKKESGVHKYGVGLFCTQRVKSRFHSFASFPLVLYFLHFDPAMTSRRIISDGTTISHRDEAHLSVQSASGRSNIAPAVPA